MKRMVSVMHEKGRTTQVKLDKKVTNCGNTIIENMKLIDNQKAFYTLVCHMITEGYFDDVLDKRYRIRKNVNIDEMSAKNARAYLKGKGYHSLNMALNDILDNVGNIDFDKAYYKMVSKT